MSSYPRRKAPASTFGNRHYWCPECHQKSLQKLRGDYKLKDGTVIRNLSRLHCSNCGANLFDIAAMREIRRQRAKKIKA